ncbi:MAG: ATP-binding protein, partial [Sarcina sp.]
MIIKRLNINNFGSIKNKILDFKPGFNIIYGENETGKSTIQAFIKVFLYGMNNKKGRSIKNNDRLKYTPFRDGRGSGELYVEYYNTDIIIKRNFGNSKKEDMSSIINNITGESIEYILKDEPGKNLLGLNYESFNNTLFISQLGLPLNSSKDDEVINKIINILQSGEENVSYNKVKLNLESMKKEITTSRQGGELDLLNEKFHGLTNEKYKKLALNKENLNKELTLIDLKNKSNNIKEEIENLEIGKKYLKKLNLEKDYEDIKSYLNKVEILKKKKQLIDSEFSQNKIEINEEFLIDIKEKTMEYFKAMDFYNEQLVDIHDLDRIIISKKEELKNHSYFGELPEDIEEKALKLMIEKETLKGNY